jgi:hypothetical protein
MAATFAEGHEFAEGVAPIPARYIGGKLSGNEAARLLGTIEVVRVRITAAGRDALAAEG